MSRYMHYVEKSKSRQWPECVLCVSVVAKEQVIHHGSTGEVQEMDHWSALCLHLDGGVYLAGSSWAGRNPQTFWKELKRLWRKYGNVWILSADCDLDWSTLGLWEMIENEQVQVHFPIPTWDQAAEDLLRRVREKDPGASGVLSPRSVSRLRSRPQGALLCGGPPNVASFRFGAEGGFMTWVDLRNYGVYMTSADGVGAEACRVMEGWWNDWKRMVDDYFDCGPRWTVGDTAYSGWKRAYMNVPVLAHDCPEALHLEQAAYFGGRCEAFYIGHVPEKVYHLDFRSLYPSVCIDEPLPARLIETYPKDGPVPTIDQLDPKCMIATVTLETELPAFPFRRDNDVIFPVGKFCTTLAGPELAMTYSCGAIRSVHAAAKYEMSPILSDYMTSMYWSRCMAEGSGAKHLQSSIKHLLVSLPGKFAQRSRRWIEEPEEWTEHLYSVWWGSDEAGNPCRYRCLGGNVQREQLDGFAYDAVPAIGAWITSLGRRKLMHAIWNAGSKNVYYCDTDSLLVNASGLDNLRAQNMVRPSTLGYLDIKGEVEKCEIRGIKWYVEDGKVTCAGQPRGEKYNCGDGEHYRMKVPLHAYLSRNERPQCELKEFSYSRDTSYRHGQVCANGIVLPFHLE